MFGVIEGFAAIWVVIGVGYLVGRRGVLGPSARPVLNKLTFNVASPALLFVTLAASDPYAVLGPQLWVAGLSAFVVLALYWVITRWWLRRSPAERTIGAMAASTVNSANLGLPIATYVLGDPALAAPVILFQLAVFTPLNLSMMDAATARTGGGLLGVLKGIVTNPMIIGSLLGLAVSLARWDVPEIIMTPLNLLAGASVPAMLLAFGISLVGSTPLRKAAGRRPDVWAATALKLVVHPLIALALAVFVFRLEGEHLFAAVVLASLPTAQNIFVNASRYDTGITVAKDTVLVTTVLGIPLMFLVAALLG
ncbi:MAG: AEC family transporter [Arthrobacter sp.]|jgi:predicted permease|nr:AEC family transporter [Arthrobacter sp.]